MNHNTLRLEIKVGIYAALEALLEQKPELFEEINLRDYSNDSTLSDLDEGCLSENGKAGWITIDHPIYGNKTYRFYWSKIL